MGPTLVSMPWGPNPQLSNSPGWLQTIISVHCRMVKFWTNIFEIDERDFEIKAIIVD